MKKEVLVDRRMGASQPYYGDGGGSQTSRHPFNACWGEPAGACVCRMLLPLPAVSEVCAACRTRVEQMVKRRKLSRWSCSIDM